MRTLKLCAMLRVLEMIIIIITIIIIIIIIIHGDYDCIGSSQMQFETCLISTHSLLLHLLSIYGYN